MSPTERVALQLTVRTPVTGCLAFGLLAATVQMVAQGTPARAIIHTATLMAAAVVLVAFVLYTATLAALSPPDDPAMPRPTAAAAAPFLLAASPVNPLGIHNGDTTAGGVGVVLLLLAVIALFFAKK